MKKVRRTIPAGTKASFVVCDPRKDSFAEGSYQMKRGSVGEAGEFSASRQGGYSSSRFGNADCGLSIYAVKTSNKVLVYFSVDSSDSDDSFLKATFETVRL